MIRIGQIPDTVHMVKVAVGQQDHGGGIARLPEQLMDARTPVARINDSGQSGLLVPQQITVGSHRPHSDRFQIHEKTSSKVKFLVRTAAQADAGL